MRTITTFSTALLLLGCDLHRPLGNNLNVQPSSPLPGAGTGKANAPSSATPTLTWNGNPSADSYEVQVDSSCHAASSCAFTSPEIDTTVTATSFTPPAPLAIPTTGPHGQTHCWRVRGCQKGACGDWSTPRCFVVGADKSLNRDLNGDGYPDFVVGEYSNQPKAYVYLGGPNLPARPALLVNVNSPDGSFGGVAMVGDVNGDGYGDYTVAIPTFGLDGEGARLMVFFGGPALKDQPDITLTAPATEAGIGMVTGCGDLNGDGYDDIAFELSHTNPTTQLRVEIHWGGPDLATSAPLVLASPHPTDIDVFSIAAAGDMNGDGFPDLILGSSWSVPDSNGWISSVVGEALIYYGGSPMDATADVIFPLPNPVSNVYYVPVAGVGDVNGDGFADVAIAPGYLSWESTVYVYYGGTAPHTSPDLTLLEEYPGTDFGLSILPAGDLNHDGYADFAVLSNDGGTFVVPAANGGTLRLPGKVFLYAGGQAPSTSPFATITAEASHPYIFGGSILDADGDGEPEILVCDSNEPNGAPSQPQIAIYRSSNNYQTPVRVLSGLGESFALGN